MIDVTTLLARWRRIRSLLDIPSDLGEGECSLTREETALEPGYTRMQWKIKGGRVMLLSWRDGPEPWKERSIFRPALETEAKHALERAIANEFQRLVQQQARAIRAEAEDALLRRAEMEVLRMIAVEESDG